MKKKVIIAITVLVGIAALAIGYLNYRGRALSPPGATSLTNEGLTISVTYGKPSVRGRVIFGAEAQGALQPYGKYWRLGANEATQIVINQDVSFNDQPVKAGTYRMYAIPGETSFEIRLNSELGQWGAQEPNYAKDVLTTQAAVTKLDSTVEQLTITLDQSGSGIVMIMAWANSQWKVQVNPTQQTN